MGQAAVNLLAVIGGVTLAGVVIIILIGIAAGGGKSRDADDDGPDFFH